MREAVTKTASGAFGQTIAIGPHSLASDVMPAEGGDDSGAEPHELLLAALGACTSMTVKMYANRKGWPLEACQVRVTIEREAGKATFQRKITLLGPLDDDQRKRLLDIAAKCPVHKTLTGTIAIDSALES
jgi:putative redox protein